MKQRSLFGDILLKMISPKKSRKRVVKTLVGNAKPPLIEALKKRVEMIKLIRRLQILEAEQAGK